LAIRNFASQPRVTYLDAHNHLHDARLAPHREALLPALKQLPVVRAVVNGTREDDWAASAFHVEFVLLGSSPATGCIPGMHRIALKPGLADSANASRMNPAPRLAKSVSIAGCKATT
jgi:hypothetical protein